MISFVDHYYSTATHPVERMACHLLKNFSATQCKTSYQHTGDPSCHNGNDQFKRLHSRLKSSAAHYNLHAHNLPDIHVGSHVAVQNPQSRLWDIFGIVIEIGPHRRYYIKTTGGRVLVHNRRFLRRRVPASVSKGLTPHTSTDPVTSGAPHTQHRSTRDKRPTRRLIEDPDWT